jgi:hypothetical protein
MNSRAEANDLAWAPMEGPAGLMTRHHSQGSSNWISFSRQRVGVRQLQDYRQTAPYRVARKQGSRCFRRAAGSRTKVEKENGNPN